MHDDTNHLMQFALSKGATLSVVEGDFVLQQPTRSTKDIKRALTLADEPTLHMQIDGAEVGQALIDMKGYRPVSSRIIEYSPTPFMEAWEDAYSPVYDQFKAQQAQQSIDAGAVLGTGDPADDEDDEEGGQSVRGGMS